MCRQVVVAGRPTYFDHFGFDIVLLDQAQIVMIFHWNVALRLDDIQGHHGHLQKYNNGDKIIINLIKIQTEF